MKRFLLFSIALILVSCSSDTDSPIDCCTVIDTGVDIMYVNEDGENLLEGENPINISNITVYHKIGSEWTRYFKGNLDYPKGLMPIEINNEKYLRIFVSTEVVQDQISETKLVFSENDEDLIKTELNLSANNTIVKKVWYNNDLKWETESNTNRQFVIVK